MSKIITTLLLLLCMSAFAQETLTNESIVQMIDLGFTDDLIVNKINTSNYKFETSIEELTKLKEAGVSGNIIALMMDKSRHNTVSKTGIYYKNANDELELIQPSVFSGTSTNAAAQRLVSGFINSKNKSTLPKATSNNVLNTNTPEFTFLFDVSTADVDNMQVQGGTDYYNNWWFKTASSPNEFVLLKLRVKERQNLREVITGKSNALGSSSGVDPKEALPFSIAQVEGNKFTVTPDSLEPGEYAFFYQGQVPGGRSNQSIFDFSVQ